MNTSVQRQSNVKRITYCSPFSECALKPRVRLDTLSLLPKKVQGNIVAQPPFPHEKGDYDGSASRYSLRIKY